MALQQPPNLPPHVQHERMMQIQHRWQVAFDVDSQPGGGSLSHPDAIVRAVVAEEHDRAILPTSVASQ